MKLSDVKIDDGEPKGIHSIQFQYGSARLKEASERQAAFHRTREEFYAEQATAKEAELRAGGVDLREQQVTGGARFTAVVDQEIGEALATARQKRDQHATKAKRFEAYAGAFANSNAIYWLTIEDVDYFALHREPGD